MDIVDLAFDAAAARSSLAPLAAFAAGAATAIGPCVAPRFIAAISLTADASGRKKSIRIASFATGLIVVSVAVTISASTLLQLTRNSALIYGALALGLGVSAWRTLRAPAACNGHRAAPGPRSVGGAFLLGASFGTIVSPCCTPVFVALAAATMSLNNFAYRTMLLFAFAVGHAAPVAAIALGGERIGTVFQVDALKVPLQVISGALLLALAAYYAVLA